MDSLSVPQFQNLGQRLKELDFFGGAIYQLPFVCLRDGLLRSNLAAGKTDAFKPAVN